MKFTSIIFIVILSITSLYGQQFSLESTIDGRIEGIMDFDGDGVCEYIIDTNKVYDFVTHQLKYTFPGTIDLGDYFEAANPHFKFPIIDFNGDGVLDIISHKYDNQGVKVLVYDLKNDIIIHEFQTGLDRNYFGHLLDVDSDGELEIILESSSYSENPYTERTLIYSTGLTTSVNNFDKKTDLLSYKLNQNYPNPFNPNTIISYEIPNNSMVRIKIYDINGQLVKSLVDEEKSQGNYETVWNGRNDYGNKVSSGTYFYQIIVDDFVQAKKMILLK